MATLNPILLLAYHLLFIVHCICVSDPGELSQTLWYMTDQTERESRDFDPLFLIFIQRSVAQFVFSTLFNVN